MTNRDDLIFDLLMNECGRWDYTYWRSDLGYVRSRGYDDGAFIDGCKIELVIYWGA